MTSVWCWKWPIFASPPGHDELIPWYWYMISILINSLWPNGAIRRHRFGSTGVSCYSLLPLVPKHYLNQCWLTIDGIQIRLKSHEMRMITINKWHGQGVKNTSFVYRATYISPFHDQLTCRQWLPSSLRGQTIIIAALYSLMKRSNTWHIPTHWGSINLNWIFSHANTEWW